MRKLIGLLLLAVGSLAPSVGHSIVWNPFTGKPDYTGTSAGTYINNQATLQTGATIYVASGTVTSFSAGTAKFSGVVTQLSSTTFADGTVGYTAGVYGGITVSSVTTVSASTQAITALDFAIGAGEAWSFDYFIFNGCDNTGGTKFAIEAPTGSVFRSVAYGLAASGTAFRLDRMEVNDTLTGAFDAQANSNGWTMITGTVKASTTAGTFHLKFASTTATQTSAIHVGSHVNARRLP